MKLEELLTAYDKLYTEKIFGKHGWKKILDEILVWIGPVETLMFVLIGLISPEICKSLDEDSLIFVIGVISFIISFLYIVWTRIGTRDFHGGVEISDGVLQGVSHTRKGDWWYWSKSTVMSASEISDLLYKEDGTLQPFCDVNLVTLPYEISVRETESAVVSKNSDAKKVSIGHLKLFSRTNPPFLVSLRGQNGPTGTTELTQDFILTDGASNNTEDTPATPYICKDVFRSFPDTTPLQAVCVDLFPGWIAKYEGGPWKFIVRNADAYDEIKSAFETLCGAVMQCLVAEKVETALTEKEPFEITFSPNDFKKVINGEMRDKAYANSIKTLVSKAEAHIANQPRLVGPISASLPASRTGWYTS